MTNMLRAAYVHEVPGSGVPVTIVAGQEVNIKYIFLAKAEYVLKTSVSNSFYVLVCREFLAGIIGKW